MIDCTDVPGPINFGCHGGVTEWGLFYAYKNPLMSNRAYPYTGKYNPTGKACKYIKSRGMSRLVNFDGVISTTIAMK